MSFVEKVNQKLDEWGGLADERRKKYDACEQWLSSHPEIKAKADVIEDEGMQSMKKFKIAGGVAITSTLAGPLIGPVILGVVGTGLMGESARQAFKAGKKFREADKIRNENLPPELR